MHVIDYHAAAFLAFPRERRAARDVVAEAVQHNGLALQFAAGGFREDSEVVLLAVHFAGAALQYAGLRHRESLPRACGRGQQRACFGICHHCNQNGPPCGACGRAAERPGPAVRSQADPARPDVGGGEVVAER